MKKQTIEPRETSGVQEGQDPAPDCGNTRPLEQVQAALRVLSGKWKGEILWLLAYKTYRFGELRRAIPGVTQHMLTTQLRDLETQGLVCRTIFAEVPPRVEYRLTEAARELGPVFRELMLWADRHFANGPGDEV